MEIFRAPAASTFITFPMADTNGLALSGLGTLTGSWIAWADTAGPNAQGNPGFQTLTGAFTEISNTGVYTGALATTELPAASPYVMLRFVKTGAATQYLLVRTASTYANVTGISGANIATPVTAGYMPIDVKQTISLTSPADNSVEKSLARQYFATAYINASSFADAFLGRTIDRSGSGGRTVGQALMALRNRINITSGTLTVYGVNDTTAEWTAVVATQAVSAIVTDIDPA